MQTIRNQKETPTTSKNTKQPNSLQIMCKNGENLLSITACVHLITSMVTIGSCILLPNNTIMSNFPSMTSECQDLANHICCWPFHAAIPHLCKCVKVEEINLLWLDTRGKCKSVKLKVYTSQTKLCWCCTVTKRTDLTEFDRQVHSCEHTRLWTVKAATITPLWSK